MKMPRNAGGSRGCPGGFVAGTLIALLGADAEAIENIRVGDRVQTTQSSSVTAVDSSWRLVELEGVSSGELEESLHVRLLRSSASLEAHGVSGSGDHVYLKLKELGFEGWLRVVGIQDAPEISSGPGRVVLSTFTRLSNDVYEVGFVGGAVLRGTGGHPLWSLDRDDWVSVRDLQIGERLQTAEGAVSVEALEKVRGLHRVYNLEVEGDHEYLVGEAGVRAHNQSACTRLDAAVRRHGGVRTPDGARFPTRRAARQAASEVAGDLGSNPNAIRRPDFRGGPRTWRNSKGKIGVESSDRTRGWRDDSLGHPRFGAGPHVSVWAEGQDFHLWY